MECNLTCFVLINTMIPNRVIWLCLN